ncbi:hypothetical protein K353_03208 [Kitasatospora sp. SolWspMP-SS2h]|nr:hypothetical protein K353_03208 [Kitasatospora sp. SolWspMP-SS2h]
MRLEIRYGERELAIPVESAHRAGAGRPVLPRTADGGRGRRAAGGGAGVIRVLLLTTFDLDECRWGALRVGAAGSLLKDLAAEALADGVRAVARGGGVLAPCGPRRLRRVLRSRRPGSGRCWAASGAGLSNAEAAARAHTAETHVSRVLAGLGLRQPGSGGDKRRSSPRSRGARPGGAVRAGRGRGRGARGTDHTRPGADHTAGTHHGGRAPTRVRRERCRSRGRSVLPGCGTFWAAG